MNQECLRCGHHWTSHTSTGSKRCGNRKCGSRLYNVPPVYKNCLRCGFTWRAVVEDPLECANPKCRSAFYDQPRRVAQPKKKPARHPAYEQVAAKQLRNYLE